MLDQFFYINICIFEIKYEILSCIYGSCYVRTQHFNNMKIYRFKLFRI